MAEHRLTPATIGDSATITGDMPPGQTGSPAGDTSIPTEN
jgi:hypothetical protein